MRTGRVFTRSDAAQLAELVTRVDAGDLQIGVAERRPLTDLAAVHGQAAAGAAISPSNEWSNRVA